MSQEHTDTELSQAEQELSFARGFALEHEIVSPEVRVLARKNEGTILRYLQKNGAGKVAQDIGISDSALSRYIRNGRAAFAAILLARLGLRIVPADAKVFIEPEEYR